MQSTINLKKPRYLLEKFGFHVFFALLMLLKKKFNLNYFCKIKHLRMLELEFYTLPTFSNGKNCKNARKIIAHGDL